MKNIIIPEQTPTSIAIEEIDAKVHGIIISYINKNPTGCITYDYECEIWTWHPTIDSSNESDLAINREVLSELTYEVINAGKANKFKLMEFYYDY